MAAGDDNAHVVTVCLTEDEADTVLDVFAVLRGITEIERAARCFLQQLQRRVGNEFDAAESDPRCTAFVEIAGNDFKRRTGFAAEQHGAAFFHGRLKLLLEFLNDGAVAEFVEGQARRHLHFAVFEGAVDGREQLLQGNRFFQKVERADFGGFDGGVDAGVSAHHHHGHVELSVFRPLFEQGNPVAVRHPYVQQHHGGTGLVAQLARLFGVLRQSHGITFVLEDFREQVADTYFVIYN